MSTMWLSFKFNISSLRLVEKILSINNRDGGFGVICLIVVILKVLLKFLFYYFVDSNN